MDEEPAGAGGPDRLPAGRQDDVGPWPLLIWIDAGIQRILAGQATGLRGEQYESALVAQTLTTLWSLGARFRTAASGSRG